MVATPPGSPTYLTAVIVDPFGQVADSEFPVPLPYGLSGRQIVRMVEDVQELIHELNSLLESKNYGRLEDLMDPAGFSGLLSRSVADRLSRAGRALVVNKYHNGYPDLIPAGRFANDTVAHSDEGVEVKASRDDSSWQSHGPRAGWFVVVQFEIDDHLGVATHDRSPTRLVAVLAAKLTEDDWNWQPAKAGRIRSGTASVKPTGVSKLRAGAIWVRPQYQARHQELRINSILSTLGRGIDEAVTSILKTQGTLTVPEIADALGNSLVVPPWRLTGRVTSSLKRLREKGMVKHVAMRPARFSSP